MRRGTLIMIIGLFVLLTVAAYAQYRIGQRHDRLPVATPGATSAPASSGPPAP
jgi:hypothetical protein